MKSTRRWYQHNLRSLFLLILVVSMGMSWVAVILQKARRQEEAALAIRNAGGEVAYDYLFDSVGNLLMEDPEPPGPAWLRKVVGEHFFTSLRFVDFSCTPNTDVGLVHLKGLPELPTLGLWGSQVTDVGLVHLEGLTKLRKLYLSYTTITDAGIEHLSRLNQLRILDLRWTQISDTGLKHIKGLQNLEDLRLSGSKITDMGLRDVRELNQLKILCLPETNITDAGLEYLAGLRELKELWLLDTKVTADGVRKLQKMLPNCDIHYSNPRQTSAASQPRIGIDDAKSLDNCRMISSPLSQNQAETLH